jgi:hypothetical protein
MRILLIVALLLSACGKKPAPKSPASSASEQKEDTGAKNGGAPDNADDADKDSGSKTTSDPCDGSE